MANDWDKWKRSNEIATHTGKGEIPVDDQAAADRWCSKQLL